MRPFYRIDFVVIPSYIEVPWSDIPGRDNKPKSKSPGEKVKYKFEK